MMFVTASDIFSTMASTACYSSQASSQQGAQWVLPVPACQAECEETGTAGLEEPEAQSCPSSPGSQLPCWKFAGLPEEKHIASCATLKRALRAGCSSPVLPIVHLSPWMVGGQTMRVCWKGSAWVQSWVGRVCRGTPCCVRPGMLMVACW